MTCKRCLVDRPEDQFYRDKSTALGRRTTCKPCTISRCADNNRRRKLAARRALAGTDEGIVQQYIHAIYIGDFSMGRSV